ncbi:class I SAM-dependent methyltransferase [Xanthobacter sp.]|uniref:class I SAM-dependent methyltransferase n=1 Tax=Xanthobacter sp. TaxID=35809 RepID=UPI0025FAC892|nr:class I SAM-dependent methyltransferase [Xanthobacter sp.]
MNGFDDAAAVARYAENPPRLVPGYGDLQRMTRLLMAETAPADGCILVVGAGGGLELRAFAEAQPGWGFVGIDPSAEMLKLATRSLGPFADRVDLHEGYIASAPTGPFDAACCLLTLHFVPLKDRLSTLTEIRRRLKPGAPDGPARDLWFDRFGAFAAGNGVAFDPQSGGARVVGARLPILSPEEEVDILRTAGFTDPQLFYAALTFRGWVACA